MKKIYSILSLFLLVIIVTGCQEGLTDISSNNGMGYLKLDVSTVTSTVTKADAIEYDAKQLAVQILDEEGNTVKSTDDYTNWDGELIALKAGRYIIKAASYGYAETMSKPYYAGADTIDIVATETITSKFSCTLANVKVTVKFDETFKKAFTYGTVALSSAKSGINQQTFLSNSASSENVVYFPVANLTYDVTVITKNGGIYTLDSTFTNVKAREHYIFTLKTAEQGNINGGITVDTDPTETIHNFTIIVPQTASTELKTTATAVWSSFVDLKGSVPTKAAGVTIDSDNVGFEYKLESEEEWQAVTNEIEILEDDQFTIRVSELEPNTDYQFRMVYTMTEGKITSSAIKVTTDKVLSIPNLSFDGWSTRSDLWSPNAAGTDVYWDSGNEGAASASVTPTFPEENYVISGKAVRMESKLASVMGIEKFAAGNIFTGSYAETIIDWGNLANSGAKLNFGQPFDGGRPTHLNGHYKYTPGNVNCVGNTDAIKAGDPDKCSIYIALLDWTAPFVVNTPEGIFVDFTSDSVIAYGELEDEHSVNESMSSYQEFSIALKYRNLTKKPSYILIVASASKYGDYFTGSSQSVLLIDEFSLEYGEPVIDSDYIK